MQQNKNFDCSVRNGTVKSDPLTAFTVTEVNDFPGTVRMVLTLHDSVRVVMVYPRYGTDVMALHGTVRLERNRYDKKRRRNSYAMVGGDHLPRQ